MLAPYRFTSGNGADLHDSGYHARRAPHPHRRAHEVVQHRACRILGSRLADQTRYDYLKKFGIGDPTGLAYPGQSDGILHPVSSWDDQTKYATMFGQGVSATQLQMVDAYQALANGGKRIPLQPRGGLHRTRTAP